MTAAATAKIEKLSTYARQISENGMVFVSERNGSYWLGLNYADGRPSRIMMAVGNTNFGLRDVKTLIREYFEAK